MGLLFDSMRLLSWVLDHLCGLLCCLIFDNRHQTVSFQTVSTALSIILYISSFGWKFVWSQLNWLKHFNWYWSWPITKTSDWAIPGLCTSFYLLSLSKGHKLRIWLWVELTLQSTVRPSMSFQGFTMGPNQLFIHEWSRLVFIFGYLAKRTQNASGHYPC